MPFTILTNPNTGDATRQSLASGIIDDLIFLYGIFASLNGATVPNGSFELDSNSDGIPDEWTRTLFTGGSFAIETGAGNFIHGLKSIKFTHPGGGGNGGGYITSTDFFEWNEKLPIALQWSHKVTAAGMREKVEVLWYDSSQTIISTGVAYTSVTNPTSWTVQGGGLVPPANTRYAKLRITGGDSSVNVAGSSYWDDIKILPVGLQNEFEFSAPGTYVIKPTKYFVELYCLGAGGGGAGGNSASNSGGGGGGGALAIKYQSVIPGTEYTLTIGAGGGGGGASSDGAAGGSTTFSGSGITTVIGGGGGGGVFNGAGGVGGSAFDGDTNISGIAGGTQQSGPERGGDGGASASDWSGGLGGSGAGNTGRGPGGGGGGGNTTGAAGANGYARIRY
jgi:glycine rich protein